MSRLRSSAVPKFMTGFSSAWSISCTAGRLEWVPENATHIVARKLVGIHNARAVAHQTALLRELAPLVDRGNGKLFRVVEHFLASAVEERVGGDEQGGDAAELSEGGIEIILRAGFRGRGKCQPHRPRRPDQSRPLVVALGTVRVDEHADDPVAEVRQ